jgi:hypothetical protein
MRRLALLAVLISSVFPATALAASSTTSTPQQAPSVNPFGPLPEAQQQQDTTTTQSQPVSTSSGSSLTNGQQLALIIGGALVIALVGYLIMRDARRRAPLRHARVRAAAAPPPPTPPRPGARGLHTGRGKGGKTTRKKRRR